MNKISWESWNSIEDEMCQKEKQKNDSLDISDDLEDKQEIIAFPPITQPHIDTPFGKYDPESPFRPAQRWDCWVGHTNFRLTKGIVKALTQVEGIAAIKIMDRYSFCIGVAKLFKFKHVASEINRVLCSTPEQELINNLPEIVQKEIETLKKTISDSKYWCIFVDLDNNIYHHNTDSVADFKSNLYSLEKIKKNFGGYLLKKEEE